MQIRPREREREDQNGGFAAVGLDASQPIRIRVIYNRGGGGQYRKTRARRFRVPDATKKTTKTIEDRKRIAVAAGGSIDANAIYRVSNSLLLSSLLSSLRWWLPGFSTEFSFSLSASVAIRATRQNGRRSFFLVFFLFFLNEN